MTPRTALASAIILDDGLPQDAPVVLEGVEYTETDEQEDAALPWPDDELYGPMKRPGAHHTPPGRFGAPG